MSETIASVPPVRRAIIDVGTNSVKLLVADVAGLRITPVFEIGEQTRLGQGFYETHILLPKPVAHTADCVARFVNLAQEKSAESIRVIATSAARDALNRQDLLQAIQAASGITVEVISGEQEADWVYRGVITSCVHPERPMLIVDLGGGSTELIAGNCGRLHFRQSFQIGTVREFEQLRPSDPPTPAELHHCRERIRAFFRNTVLPSLGDALKPAAEGPVRLIGTGGTALVLAAIDLGERTFQRDRFDAYRVSLSVANQIVERLWSLPLAQRRELPGVPRDRADILLAGVVIYAELMAQLGFDELIFSSRGLRFGAMLEAENPTLAAR